MISFMLYLKAKGIILLYIKQIKINKMYEDLILL